LCDWMVCWWMGWNMNNVECDWDIVFSKNEILCWDWLGCALIRDSSRKRYPDSTNIVESYRWRYSDGESWMRFVCSLKYLEFYAGLCVV